MVAKTTAVGLPPTVTIMRPQTATVVLVGAGGTGARVAGMIIKVLRNRDTLVIVDDDKVEEKNLERQHFVERDLGEYKAEVVAQRCASEARRRGVTVTAVPEKFNSKMVPGLGIILGCVDNRTARKAIHETLWTGPDTVRRSGVWIDVGNELRTGQVVVSVAQYPVGSVSGGTAAKWSLGQQREDGAVGTRYLDADTLRICYPEMLQPEAGEANQEACAARLDMQSLAANALAASWCVTALTWILDELPMSFLGQTFSTLGGGAVISIGELKGPSRGIYTLTPRM